MVRVHPDPPKTYRGGVAQLGERVLCKHEVVGSIPSGSTRWLSKIGESASFIPSAKHHFARRVLRDARAGFLTSYRGDRSEFGSGEAIRRVHS